MPLICPELHHLEKSVFIPCGLAMTDVETELESQDYCAHTFKFGNRNVKFRAAKITPTKTGQFVTLWKRNEIGITVPYHIADNYDFYIIATRQDSNFCVFIFPKEILLEQGVLSSDSNAGKRGFRVYPIWDLTSSKQAQKTQLWQVKYFIQISDQHPIDLQKANFLLNNTVQD